MEDDAEDDGKLEIKKIEFRTLSNDLRFEVNKNKQNLKSTKLWNLFTKILMIWRIPL